MTPHLNHLDEAVQMGGHNMVLLRNKKNYLELSSSTLLSRALCMFVYQLKKQNKICLNKIISGHYASRYLCGFPANQYCDWSTKFTILHN